MALKRIANAPPKHRRTELAVCAKLKKTYGLPRLGNPTDPIDDFVYIVISNKTSPETARRIYNRVKAAFPNWESLLKAPSSKLVRLMTPAGLARVKSAQIRRALRKIERDFGEVSLESLRGKRDSETLSYLRSLRGVSDKVARCIMMYTMDAKVLPVDAHVHRIATRLGWTKRKRADQCHDELEAIVPPRWRYSFHVDCIEHGRQVCRPTNPSCDNCCIKNHCAYYATTYSETDRN